MNVQTCLFGENFVDAFIGENILYRPKTAIIELIANSWDAGATEVKITWPTSDNEQYFSISDNGHGLNKKEFEKIWRTLAYDRTKDIGDYVLVSDKKRATFGRNGVGRFAGFCFGDPYFVETCKKGSKEAYTFKVGKTGNSSSPMDFLQVGTDENAKFYGTTIRVEENSNVSISEEEIRAEIGMRFLYDPEFKCYVNGKIVEFSDIPKDNLIKTCLNVEGNDVNIYIINTSESDRTTQQHGIAWVVHSRLVGNISWKDYGYADIVDGRSAMAKKCLFIIQANCLMDCIEKDWSIFRSDEHIFKVINNEVKKFVKGYFLNETKEKRQELFGKIKTKYHSQSSQLPKHRRKQWEDFVELVLEHCPGISNKDLENLAEILIKMQLSESQFMLINELNKLDSSELGNLGETLSEWSFKLAKEVLDELATRLKLLKELESKVFNKATLEVQELQPLFHRGLWIFGAEYETIEYTSNRGMTEVIQTIFDKKDKIGSRNRPDFAISVDCSAGLYSYPSYDDDGGEIGVDRLTIIELKKPSLRLGSEEKAQCWKYVKELRKMGCINGETKVTCFVLGRSIDPLETESRNEGNCKITPITYEIVMNRAKNRLLKLYEKVNGAPFLDDQEEGMGIVKSQSELSFEEEAF